MMSHLLPPIEMQIVSKIYSFLLPHNSQLNAAFAIRTALHDNSDCALVIDCLSEEHAINACVKVLTANGAAKYHSSYCHS